jgi:hypothetical protein
VTRPARFTTADVARAAKAMRNAGFCVTGAKVEPDGTIVVLTAVPGAIPANDRNPLDRVLGR